MKFLLTRELGRLAKWLRILGFDSDISSEGSVRGVIINALREDRVILTRNHLFSSGRAVPLVQITSDYVQEQVSQVIKALHIPVKPDALFTRCVLCNEKLIAAEKTEAAAFVPEYVFETQEKFYKCPKFRHIYWQGTHWKNVEDALARITKIY